MRNISRLFLLSVLTTAALSLSMPARAVPLIRDAEIENTIRMYGGPLFAMAGLEPRAVRVYIVNDPSINAFVAGGQNIFLNTGLLLAAESPNQLIGVIAHEAGHITGGHLASTQEALKDASVQSILAFVLGAAATLAGQGRAGQAIVAGGQQVAQRSFLKYSRVQESSADQAALSFLDSTGQSARGLMEFFEKLGDQEALLTANQDPYVRTHPLNRERIEAVRAHVERSRFSDAPDPPVLLDAHARMRAKLFAFLKNPVETFRRYPKADQGIVARYAHAIAHHKKNEFAQALTIMDGLLAERPEDPYFHELRGQILMESGRPDDAIAHYAKAVSILPAEALLRFGLGQAQVSARSDRFVDDAIDNLGQAVRLAPREPTGWRWLAAAYGRKGDIGMAALATSERYLLTGNVQDALGQAKRAEQLLPKGTPVHLRAQDLVQAAEEVLERRKNR